MGWANGNSYGTDAGTGTLNGGTPAPRPGSYMGLFDAGPAAGFQRAGNCL